MSAQRRAWAMVRDPKFKRTLAFVLLTELFRNVVFDLHLRLRELEDQAALRSELRALEDVATLADLQRLEHSMAERMAGRRLSKVTEETFDDREEAGPSEAP